MKNRDPTFYLITLSSPPKHCEHENYLVYTIELYTYAYNSMVYSCYVYNINYNVKVCPDEFVYL